MSYIQHFSKEQILAGLITEHGPIVLIPKQNICVYLCASIMGQQLSIKVAAVIYKRFIDLFEGVEPSPEQILATSVPVLRSIGLSNAKANYVHNVARFAAEHGMDVEKLSAMTDEEIIQYLVPIKGVGRWTVEMLLMFALGREDVFAVDDLGIQNAMIKHFRMRSGDKKKFKINMLKRAKKWSPYRTYACMHLWKSLS
ncbi:MAG: DNA-3-methyladenine glycosylase 2 family protein [Flavitalea sp.]